MSSPTTEECVVEAKALISKWQATLDHETLKEVLDELSDLAMLALDKEREKDDDL